MKILIKDNFLLEPKKIYNRCKKIPLYSTKEFNSKFKTDESWAGVRSAPLFDVDPSVAKEIITNMGKHFKELFENLNTPLKIFVHKRDKKFNKKDWIHHDDYFDCLYVGLLYLSKTNLESGTMIYDKKKQPITDVKFVKNRMVFFDSRYLHSAYGHHDDRLNITVSIYKGASDDTEKRI
tara:strand:- start:394 stop:930 length:537 start_codon:yes stop_codon:yes gene_type:complete